jgi:hypothetical protein
MVVVVVRCVVCVLRDLERWRGAGRGVVVGWWAAGLVMRRMDSALNIGDCWIDSSSSICLEWLCCHRRGYWYWFEEFLLVPKYRGKSLFMSGLQPGRQPQAMPTLLSTDMMMKVSAPCPGFVRTRVMRW